MNPNTTTKPSLRRAIHEAIEKHCLENSTSGYEIIGIVEMVKFDIHNAVQRMVREAADNPHRPEDTLDKPKTSHN